MGAYLSVASRPGRGHDNLSPGLFNCLGVPNNIPGWHDKHVLVAGATKGGGTTIHHTYRRSFDIYIYMYFALWIANIAGGWAERSSAIFYVANVRMGAPPPYKAGGKYKQSGHVDVTQCRTNFRKFKVDIFLATATQASYSLISPVFTSYMADLRPLKFPE